MSAKRRLLGLTGRPKAAGRGAEGSRAGRRRQPGAQECSRAGARMQPRGRTSAAAWAREFGRAGAQMQPRGRTNAAAWKPEFGRVRRMLLLFSWAQEWHHVWHQSDQLQVRRVVTQKRRRIHAQILNVRHQRCLFPLQLRKFPKHRTRWICAIRSASGATPPMRDIPIP